MLFCNDSRKSHENNKKYVVSVTNMEVARKKMPKQKWIIQKREIFQTSDFTTDSNVWVEQK